MLNITTIPCPKTQISTKCPYAMTPTRVVIHNTANDATARNEIAYMHRNTLEKSFHFAVDDREIIQGIALDRNAWHAGDGHGKGNLQGIGIEICYSKSGGKRFEAAQKNAAELTAELLKKFGWSIDRVTKHEDYSGKRCPHRTLDDYGWDYFLKLVSSFLGTEKPVTKSTKKSVETLAKEVIAGKWGNGATRKQKLTAAGYDYAAVQSRVDELMGKTTKTTEKTATKTTAKKSVETLAKEVIAGKWGNGVTRRQKLTAAGYDYSAIQKRVNELMK